MSEVFYTCNEKGRATKTEMIFIIHLNYIQIELVLNYTKTLNPFDEMT